METRAPGRGELVDQGLLDQRVGELVLAHGPGQLLDHAGAQRLLHDLE